MSNIPAVTHLANSANKDWDEKNNPDTIRKAAREKEIIEAAIRNHQLIADKIIEEMGNVVVTGEDIVKDQLGELREIIDDKVIITGDEARANRDHLRERLERDFTEDEKPQNDNSKKERQKSDDDDELSI